MISAISASERVSDASFEARRGFVSIPVVQRIDGGCLPRLGSRVDYSASLGELLTKRGILLLAPLLSPYVNLRYFLT